MVNVNMNGKTIDFTQFKRSAQKTGSGLFSKMSKGKSLAVIIAVTVIAAALLFYVNLPAINLKSRPFWSYLFIVAGIFCGLYYLRMQGGGTIPPKKVHVRRLPLYILGAILILPIVLDFVTSSKLFYARAYSRILTVEDGSYEDIPSSEDTSRIALMDTSSAARLGDREIGSLTGLVSQYNVGDYTQIDLGGKPVKTAPLLYDGFFKWYRNRANGVPGYVLVDPVAMRAEYRALEQGMRYVPSAFFQKNLIRHIRFHYPTKMFDNVHFEIDEEGRPWYVASTFNYLVGMFGGKQVTGAILVDPANGNVEYHPTGEIPRWVDVVYNGDLICEQYNYHAQYHAGFWNTVFGQAGCKKVTEYTGNDDAHNSDYGYLSKDGDIWIYTGVTSLNNDSSNLGFILSNERTEETLYITCAGADEFSAMGAAEGEVQEKRYNASFPSLIRTDGKPTYIMVLKDNSGLVKMYAAVNVEQYNVVATASNQGDCISKYRALLAGTISADEAVSDDTPIPDEGPVMPDPSAFEEKTVTVMRRETIVESGNTYLYIVDAEKNIYRAKYTDVLGMLLVEDGETIKIMTDGTWFLMADNNG